LSRAITGPSAAARWQIETSEIYRRFTGGTPEIYRRYTGTTP
jgi:hypothetical protein